MPLAAPAGAACDPRGVLGFEEIDRQVTPMGEISLRRRDDPVLRAEVYEVKLDDEHLMSTAFTAAEEALGHLGVDAAQGDHLDVAVGGLGLGYTAQAVLEHERVRSLEVVEVLEAVIGWHHDQLVPAAAGLVSDPRCRLVHDDFFAAFARDPDGSAPPHRFHAVLLDVDHSPRNLLHEAHGALYRPDGLQRLAAHLHPGGCFGLWSDDPPDDELVADLEAVFATCEAHVVTFPNPYVGGESSNTVYVACTSADPTTDD